MFATIGDLSNRRRAISPKNPNLRSAEIPALKQADEDSVALELELALDAFQFRIAAIDAFGMVTLDLQIEALYLAVELERHEIVSVGNGRQV